jgi:hypothetical protein
MENKQVQYRDENFLFVIFFIRKMISLHPASLSIFQVKSLAIFFVSISYRNGGLVRL